MNVISYVLKLHSPGPSGTTKSNCSEESVTHDHIKRLPSSVSGTEVVGLVVCASVCVGFKMAVALSKQSFLLPGLSVQE